MQAPTYWSKDIIQTIFTRFLHTTGSYFLHAPRALSKRKTFTLFVTTDIIS